MGVRVALGVLAAAILVLGASAAVAVECPALATAGAAVEAARGALKAIPIADMETDVAPPVQAGVERLKDAARLVVRAAMDCQARNVDPRALEAELTALGGSSAVGGSTAAAYGGLSYAVADVPAHKDLLAVVAKVDIECGDDGTLMLYGRRAGRWREMMVRQSPPYRQVSGGWGDFRYAVSPPDARGRWYVATISSLPWCSSAWNQYRYDLSRPGPTPDTPRVFFSGADDNYIDDDDGLFRADAHIFELRHHGPSIDGDAPVRTHLLRYTVDGERVVRVPPVALNPRDFVDEWIASDWRQARTWSSATGNLRDAHRDLEAARRRVGLHLGATRRCGDASHQVEVNPDEGGRWFLRVRGGRAYVLQRATRRSDPGCRGPDLTRRQLDE